MSRGFVKEEDQEEAPIIPPRAALPEGLTNYVTPAGYQALKDERLELEQQLRDNPEKRETERRRRQMLIDGKLRALDKRIASARIIDPAKQPQNEVRFGAQVRLKALSGPTRGKTMQVEITGVDEADVKKQKIAFVSPLAKAAAGCRAGEEFTLNLGAEERRFAVLEISYPQY